MTDIKTTDVKSQNVVIPFTDTKIYTLKCGAQVGWIFQNPFEDYDLHVFKGPHSSDAKGCGNPWNWMTTSEANKIREVEPKNKNKPCKLEDTFEHHFYDSKTLITEIKKIINGDCWGVFTSTASRDKVVTMYYDSRTEESDTSQESRKKITDDPTPLINEIDNGLTAGFVLGNTRFYEYYIFKIPPATNASNTQNTNFDTNRYIVIRTGHQSFNIFNLKLIN